MMGQGSKKTAMSTPSSRPDWAPENSQRLKTLIGRRYLINIQMPLSF